MEILEKSNTTGVIKDQLYVVRAMFYLLTPNETYFENAEDVPDLTSKAALLYFVFYFVEQAIFFLKTGKFTGRISDVVASTSAGIIHAFPYFLMRKIDIASYTWCYDNLRLYDLPFDSIWTYILTFLFVDMMYYWFHRAAHEVNLFWAAHQTHHSSEDYNFTTALRQSIFQKYTSWFFYLPLALFVRPSIFIVHSHMNLIYQFWIHTELIDSVGPLEYIINTPSHHRVHHGRNPYCIDKNYAAVLIIWDRLFGTFAWERKEEELAYGLVHPVGTFDPTYLQVFNYKYIWGRFWSSNGLKEKFSILFKGPGWVPGSPRLGNPEDLPKIESPIKKYDPKIHPMLNYYVAIHFSYMVVFFSQFALLYQKYPNGFISLYIIVMMYSLTCFGYFFDAKPKAVYYETIRCLIFIGICLNFPNEIKLFFHSSYFLNETFKYLNIISFIVMFSLSALKFLSKKEFKNSLKVTKNFDQNNNSINGTIVKNEKKNLVKNE